MNSIQLRVGFLILGSCAVARSVAAQAAPPQVVREALLAQVTGFGGCVGLDSTEAWPVSFFPTVSFWSGQCTLEHGDSAQPIAAIDSAGQVYLLDSATNFTFLIVRHPPVGLDSASALQYAFQALVLQGKIPLRAHLLTPGGHIPAEVCRRARVPCTAFFRGRVNHGGRAAYLTAFTEDAIYSAGPVILDLSSGRVAGAVTLEWEGGRETL